MKILVVNAGSSSLKFKLYNMDTGDVLAEGNCQRVGLKDSELKYTGSTGVKETFNQYLATHKEALEKILELLTVGSTKVLDSVHEIAAAGHRVAMGGTTYVQSVLVDSNVIQTIYELGDAAPLHNPPEAKAMEVCRQVFGEDFPMVAVFDTAFHQTMPEESFIYSLPYEYYEKYRVRRSCFHGMSHQFVTEAYGKHTGNDVKLRKMVTCHMGGGSSLTAVKFGKSVDNTFGFGIGQGPMGGTRAGTTDYTALSFIMKKENLTFGEMEDILARKSGLMGISGISSDEYELEKLAMKGNPRATLALKVLAHQIKKYIGSYAFEMGGLDTIIFTGGIGENSDYMRSLICNDLEAMGIVLDSEANIVQNRRLAKISAPQSAVEIWIIPTNEEWVIANDTYNIVKAL